MKVLLSKSPAVFTALAVVLLALAVLAAPHSVLADEPTPGTGPTVPAAADPCRPYTNSTDCFVMGVCPPPQGNGSCKWQVYLYYCYC